jgi:mandelate racemase
VRFSAALQLLDEGGFRALKLRLGRERASDDLAALNAVKGALDSEAEVMVDYSQALNMAEALSRVT